MAQSAYAHVWNGTPMSRDEWIDAMSSVGLQYQFDACHSGASMHAVCAGQTAIVNLDIAWQSVAPILHRGDGGDLFVQVVRSGTRWVEQRAGQAMKLGPGDMAVVDPLAWCNAHVRERTRLSILRIPRSALWERGLRDRFREIYLPDPSSPDVCAVRDFVLYLTSQAGKVGEAMLARLAEHCLDLIDVLVNDHSGPALGRSDAVTAMRAKQLILRHLCDPDLSPARIAAELNISISSLTRALRAEGLSVMRYAWSLRLERAARQLSTDASRGAIKAIARQCGFTNHAHFSRVFRARYDMTPREYAANHRMVGSKPPG